MTPATIALRGSKRLAVCMLCLAATACAPEKLPTNEAVAVLVFRIEGEDGGARYNGFARLAVSGDERGSVRGIRELRYVDGTERRAAVDGTLVGRTLQVRFRDLAPPSQGEVAGPRRLAGAGPKVESRSYAIGRFDRDLRSASLTHRNLRDNRVRRASESWTLESRDQPWTVGTQRIKTDGKWVSVPLSLAGGSVVKISAPGSPGAQGFFLPRGTPAPETNPIEQDCVGCATRGTSDPVHGRPNYHSGREGPVWLRRFTDEERKTDWVFWFLDDRRAAPAEVGLRVMSYDPRRYANVFCNPWVTVDASPAIVGPGQPVTIRVRALAFAGLDMFWWFGATGVPALDVAHIRAGNGQSSGEATWSVTIDQPGTYRFGANARDLLYWTDPGTPHQASESCGLAYDEVTVVAGVRKSYTVGFILLAPAGTDVATPEFQRYLTRLEDIKAALVGQFATSTDGRGAVDISHETMVLMPPGPVYGLEDGFQMWAFLGSTLRETFYTRYADVFDFLAIYEVYPDKTIGGRHQIAKTFVAGLGISPSDAAAGWGSAGRLQGLGLVTDVRDLPDTYDFVGSQMHLLLHEVFGHQWGVYAGRLEAGGFHFGTGIESPTFTVLYGRPWRKIDETHFTTADVQDPATGTFKVTFHPWMLYIAGMKTRGEVPEVLMDVIPDTPPTHRYDLVTTTGTYVNLTLQSLIDQYGDRYDVSW